jgi:uncharacterized protein YjiS (DUF1127 family)
MISTSKPFASLFFHLPLPRLGMFWIRRKRRISTVDLISSSPHLLRDIGLGEGHIVVRRR